MKIPKYHETFIPILELLNTVDSISSRDLAVQVRDKYYSNLPNELLEKNRWDTNAGSRYEDIHYIING